MMPGAPYALHCSPAASQYPVMSNGAAALAVCGAAPRPPPRLLGVNAHTAQRHHRENQQPTLHTFPCLPNILQRELHDSRILSCSNLPERVAVQRERVAGGDGSGARSPAHTSGDEAV